MDITVTANYTDLYQIAMGQAYFLGGLAEKRACFDYFFRKAPFAGVHAVFAGLDDVLEVLESWHFSDADLDYLASRGFEEDYLAYLRDLRFQGDVHAPREGDVVFAYEPVVRVEGTIIEAQLVETLLLNLLNFESLVATKAARMRAVAGDGVLSEFGLRRAHGPGGVLASRAAVIGGFDSTSDVYAAQTYGLHSEGTMAHSFIQCHDDELTAFRSFAQARPQDTVLLVDTYDTLESGVPNAITTALEMRERGERLRAIRLDSGDLAFLSRRARHMLDEASLQDVKIAASNQLDEDVIHSLRQQEAPIDIFGVGTSLVTGRPAGALDGVYKLAQFDGKPRIKVSENPAKTTLPGRKQVYRYFDDDGMLFGADAIVRADEPEPDHLIHPFDEHKSMRCPSMRSEPLLEPVMENGRRVAPRHDIEDIRGYCAERLALLPPEYRRFENPHIYKVGISEPLQKLRDDLRRKHAQASSPG